MTKHRKKHRKKPKHTASKTKHAEATSSAELATGVGMADAHLLSVYARIEQVAAALDDATSRFAAIVARFDNLPTSAASNDDVRELRRRIEQMLVAQRRTNELLDLALGVAIESDHTARPSD